MKSPEERLHELFDSGRWEKIFSGVLQSSIDSHGPITKENKGSAAKRVATQVRALLKDIGVEAVQGTRAEVIIEENEKLREKLERQQEFIQGLLKEKGMKYKLHLSVVLTDGMWVRLEGFLSGIVPRKGEYIWIEGLEAPFEVLDVKHMIYPSCDEPDTEVITNPYHFSGMLEEAEKAFSGSVFKLCEVKTNEQVRQEAVEANEQTAQLLPKTPS
jgi:hypothetical protein